MIFKISQPYIHYIQFIQSIYTNQFISLDIILTLYFLRSFHNEFEHLLNKYKIILE